MAVVKTLMEIMVTSITGNFLADWALCHGVVLLFVFIIIIIIIITFMGSSSSGGAFQSVYYSG